MKYEALISWLPLGIVALAALVSLRSFLYHYPVSLRRLSLLWVVNFCVDLAGHITKELHIRNHWLYNIYGWVLYLSLAHLYYGQIKSNRIRVAIRYFYIVFPVLVAADSFFFEPIMSLQSLVIVAGGSFIIFLAAAYFREMYLSDESEKITRYPWFWFSCGFLVNFGGTVPFLGMLNHLWKNYPAFTLFYYTYFHNLFVVLLNTLIIAGFLCRKNYRRSS